MWEINMSTSRMDIVQRRQMGRAIFPRWKMSLEEALNQRVATEQFLDIEETEQLRIAFFNVVRQHNRDHRFATRDALGQLLSEIEQVLARGGERAVVLYHRYDKFIGAVRLDTRAIASALEAVWRVAEEDLCVSTPDLNNGFCLEENYYDECGIYVPVGVFELTAWGDFAPA